MPRNIEPLEAVPLLKGIERSGDDFTFGRCQPVPVVVPRRSECARPRYHDIRPAIELRALLRTLPKLLCRDAPGCFCKAPLAINDGANIPMQTDQGFILRAASG